MMLLGIWLAKLESFVLKKQIANFILVGVVNTLFGYSVYAVFIYLGLNYILAVLMATIFGVLFNFKTIGKFVFDSSHDGLIGRFVFVYAIVFIINIITIKILKEFGLNDYISGLLAIVPASVASFILNKYFVFER